MWVLLWLRVLAAIWRQVQCVWKGGSELQSRFRFQIRIPRLPNIREAYFWATFFLLGSFSQKMSHQKIGHLKKSVVVGITGQALIFRKSVNSQKKRGHLKNEVVVWISDQTLRVRKSGNSQKKRGAFEKWGGSWNSRPNVNNQEKHE